MAVLPEGFEVISQSVTDIPEGFEVVTERAGYASTKEEPGFFGSLGEMITGSERETEQMQAIPELASSGLLSGEDQLKVAALSPVLLSTTNPDEIGKIITSNFPNIGMTYNLDAQGNPFPILVNNQTGAAAQINKPGISGMDVLQGLGLAAAFTPAGRAASIAGAAGKSAFTETAIQASQAATGGDFDTEDVALSAGLGVAGKGLEDLATTSARAIRGKLGGQQAAATEFAEEVGAPIMTSDIVPPTTFAGRSARAAGEKVPVTGTGTQRAEQQEARSKLVEDYAAKFGEYNPSDVYESLQRQTSKVKKAAGSRRQNVVDQMSGVEAVTPESKTISAIDKEIDRLTVSPTSGEMKKTADMATVSRLQDYRDDLISDPSFDSLEQLRTTFREGVKGDERMVIPSRSEASIERIYKAMSDDLDDSVGAALGEAEKQRWKSANRVYAQEAGKIKDTRLKSILKKGEATPEVVNNMLYSKKPSEFKTLYRSLDSKGKAAARSGIISKAIDLSKGSPDRFLSELKKMSDRTGIAFKGTEGKYLEGLKAYLETTKRASEAGVLTKSGQELFQLGAPVAVVGDVLGTGGAGTGAAAAYGAMSRVYESKPIRKLMGRLASTPKGSAQFDQIISELQPLLTGAAQSYRALTDE